ncbi:MAG: acyltransferase [Lachnospiraceae bacterium]
MTMKRERIFYLDFIRAIAVILILLTHYNAIFLYLNPQQLDKVVVTYKVCNLYIGDFGVALFFIISGAALMYVYESKLELVKFYKKRFISLYPMFWIAWICAFTVRFLLGERMNASIPKVNFLYTILGFDSYVAGIKPTFYIVGEWFLGCIILIYLVFPLLRWGINKRPVWTCGLLILLYLVGVFYYPTSLVKAELLFVRLPEFAFGMLFIKYFKKVKWSVAVISFVILIGNTLFAPPWNTNIQTTYVGICAFLVLVFISNYAKCTVLEKFVQFISKYSYAIFLIHHVLFYRITSYFDLYHITVMQSYLIFTVSVSLIMILSVILNWFTNEVTKYSGKMFTMVIKKNN